MIRLLFTKSPDFISRAIRCITGDKVSHVGVQFEPDLVLSAESPVVIEQPMAQFLHGRILMANYEAFPAAEKYLDIEVARLHKGNRYATNEIVGFAWVEACRHWFHKNIRNPIHDPNRDFCSEVALVLDQQGLVPEFEGLGVEFGGSRREATSPGDLLARLQAGGPTFRRVFDLTLPIVSA